MDFNDEKWNGLLFKKNVNNTEDRSTNAISYGISLKNPKYIL